MSKITADLVKTGFSPILEIMNKYDNREDFFQDLDSYFNAGVIISTPTFFLMGKPIDSSQDPRGQWWAKNPDTWFVKWASGKGAMKYMISVVKPLAKVMFSRVKGDNTSEFKTYDWDKFTRRIK